MPRCGSTRNGDPMPPRAGSPGPLQVGERRWAKPSCWSRKHLTSPSGRREPWREPFGPEPDDAAVTVRHDAFYCDSAEVPADTGRRIALPAPKRGARRSLPIDFRSLRPSALPKVLPILHPSELANALGLRHGQLIDEALALFLKAVLEVRRGRRLGTNGPELVGARL